MTGPDVADPPITALALGGELANGLARRDAATLAALRRLHDGNAVELLVLGLAPRPAIDPVSVIAARHGLFPRWGFLAGARPGRDHPYNLARRVLALDHLSSGRAGALLLEDQDEDPVGRGAVGAGGSPWVHGSVSAGDLVDDASVVLRELWNSWPRDSLVADRETGVFARTERIRRIDHHGAYRVAGPLSSPSSVQGEPVLGRVDTAARGVRIGGAAELAVVLRDPDAGAVRSSATGSTVVEPAGIDALLRERVLAELRSTAIGVTLGLVFAADDTAQLADLTGALLERRRAVSRSRGSVSDVLLPRTLRDILGFAPRSIDLSGRALAFPAAATGSSE